MKLRHSVSVVRQRRPPRAGIEDEHLAAWTKGKCRWCLEDVAPPRRTFCSDACVHEWKLRTDPGYLRKRVFERDKGRCAKCGLDCQALADRLLRLLYENPSVLDVELARHSMTRKVFEVPDTLSEEQRRRLIEIRIRYGGGVAKDPELEVWVPGRSFWEADHVLEVADGGGSCDLSNLQTLCLRCHRTKSAESRAARAERSRNVRPPEDIFPTIPRPDDDLFED